MKIIQSIVARIYAFWMLLVFVIFMLLLLPLLMIARCLPSKDLLTHIWYKVWISIFLFLTGNWVCIYGKQKIDKTKKANTCKIDNDTVFATDNADETICTLNKLDINEIKNAYKAIYGSNLEDYKDFQFNYNTIRRFFC